jgi:hypothetical protein
LYFIGTAGFTLLKRFSPRPGFAILLGFLLPGLGHVYWREYLFGWFVFLVMVIASVLVFFSFLVQLPPLLEWLLFGLPVVFFAFTFVDLVRSIKRKRATFSRNTTAAMLFVAVAFAGNLLFPLSPTNFLLRNFPELGIEHSGLAEPLLETNDVYLVDRAAYRVNLFFLNQGYVHSRPDRWDFIAFDNLTSDESLGLVIGYGGEEVTFHGDSLFIDGFPPDDRVGRPSLAGEIPLTLVETGSILVATLNEGALVGVKQISDRNIIGKVHPLF